MARVTVEDCVLQIPNRFELVMLAAQRARDISAGAQLTLDRDNDKNPVVALREIADVTVEFDGLRNSIVKGLQKTVEADEPEEEIIDFISSEQDLAREQVQAEAGDEEGWSVEEVADEEEPVFVEDGVDEDL